MPLVLVAIVLFMQFGEQSSIAPHAEQLRSLLWKGRFEDAALSIQSLQTCETQGPLESLTLALAVGKGDPALAAASVLIQNDPVDNLFRILRGDAYLSLRRYGLAISDYSHVAETSNDPIVPSLRIAEAYLAMDRVTPNKVSQQKALQLLTDCVERHPVSVDALRVRGRAYQQFGKYKEAIADFSFAYGLTGSESELLIERGAAYRKMHCYFEALADCSAAVALDSKSWRYAVEKAQALRDLGLVERAKRELLRARDIAPHVERIHSDLASLAESTKDYNGAITSLDEAIKVSILPWSFLVRRGMLFVKTDDYVHAEQDLDAALALFPKDADALFWRGYCRVRLKKIPDAASDFAECLSTDPKHQGAYEEWILSLAEAGAWGMAQSVADRAIQNGIESDLISTFADLTEIRKE